MERKLFNKSIFVLFLLLMLVLAFIVVNVNAYAQTFTVTIYDENNEVFSTFDIDDTQPLSKYYQDHLYTQDDLDMKQGKEIKYYIFDETTYVAGEEFSFDQQQATQNIVLQRQITNVYVLEIYELNENKEVSNSPYVQTSFNEQITPTDIPSLEEGYSYYRYNVETSQKGEKFTFTDTDIWTENLILVKLREYTVSFKISDTIETHVVTNLDDPITVPTVETAPAGYEFKYWKTIESISGNIYSSPQVNCKNLNGDFSLFAHFEKIFNFNLTIDPDYGDLLSHFTTTTFTQKTISDVHNYIIENLIVGYKIVAKYNNEVVIENKTFCEIYNTLTKDVTDDINLFLTVVMEEYDFIVDYKGAAIDPTSVVQNKPNVKYDVTYFGENIEMSVPLPKLVREGHDFVGYRVVGSEDIFANDTVVISKSACKNYSIEAVFTPHVYTITLVDGISNDILGTIQVAYNSAFVDLDKPENKFSKEGYIFDKWVFKGADNKETVYTIQTQMSIARDIQLHAIFTPKVYKVTKNLGYEDSVKTTIDVTFDSNYEILNPLRVGYEFVEWKINSDIFASKGKYTIADDVEITAIWKAKTYKLTVNVNEHVYEFDATFDAPVSIYDPDMKNHMNFIIGFFAPELKVGRSGQIDKYTVPFNLTLTAKDFAPYNFDEQLFNSLSLNLDNLVDASLYLNDEKVQDLNTEEPFIITKIGNYNIKLYSGNNLLYQKEFVLDADLGIENKIYEDPIILNKVDAQIFVDGKEINQEGYRITKNGKHTIKVVGVNGYEKTFEVEYKNNNILFAMIFTAIAALLAVVTGVILFTGRGKLVKYVDNN